MDYFIIKAKNKIERHHRRNISKYMTWYNMYQTQHVPEDLKNF